MIGNLAKKLNLPGFVFRYYAATFFGGLTFYVAVLVPFYTQWGHITLTQVQILQSWLMFWILILNIPTGAIADRLGRKYSVGIGGFITALASILYATIPGFVPFLVAEFLTAVGISFVSGASSALLYDLLRNSGQESESKKIFGRASSIGQLGTIIAAPIGSVIAARLGLNAPMFFSAIPSILAGLIVLTIDEPSSASDGNSPRMGLFESSRRGLSFLLFHRRLRYLVINDILVYIGAYFLVWLYQPMLVRVGLAILYFGLVRASFSLAGMLATMNLTYTEKLFGSAKNFVNYTALVVSAMLIMVAAFPGTLTVIIGIVVVGGLASARSVYLNMVMNEDIPTEQRATVLSAMSTINTMVFGIANPAVGFIADQSLRLAFLTVGLFPLIVFLIMPYLPGLRGNLSAVTSGEAKTPT